MDPVVSLLLHNTKQQSDIQVLKLQAQLEMVQQQNINLKRINKVLNQSIENRIEMDSQKVKILEIEVNDLKQVERVTNIYREMIKMKNQQQKQQDKIDQQRQKIGIEKYEAKFNQMIQKINNLQKTCFEDQNKRKSQKKKIVPQRQQCQNLPPRLKPQQSQITTECYFPSSSIGFQTNRSRGNSSFYFTTLSQTYNNPWYKKCS